MALITAKTVVLRGKTILVDGSRFETRGGNDAALSYQPALVSVRHLCRKPARVAGGVMSSRPQEPTATPWQRHAN
jgi:hypothetical protein